jgi:hypothetical protein
MVSLLLGGLGLVAGSVWMEDRYPSDDPARVLLPRTQRWVTRPIVEALGRGLQETLRARGEAKYMKTGLSLDQTISRFLDSRAPLSERRVYAYRLAREGSPHAAAALLEVLRAAPPGDKAFMAVLIGKTRNPAAKEWLWPLLGDPRQEVVIGALRGLSLIGGDDVAERVAAILSGETFPEAVRVEAAIALGTMHTNGSMNALAGALDRMPGEEIAKEILSGLGRHDFPQVAVAFDAVIRSPEASETLRTAAVEALAESSAEAVPYLSDLAAGDASAEIRASAAWAIAAHGEVGSLGPRLTAMVEVESEPDVRRRLYEALLVQNELPAGRLLTRIDAEEDPSARIAGFNALGRAARLEPASAIARAFDTQVVPELLRTATTANSTNLQMRAVFALRRAGTPAARQALEAVAGQAAPQIATAARNGLRAPPSR